MVTSGVRRTVEEHFRWGEGEKVELKGRRGMETAFPVMGRETAGTTTSPGPDIVAARAVADREDNTNPRTELPPT